MEQAQLMANGQAHSKNTVHFYGRGADIRMFKNEDLNTEIVLWVNKKYVYHTARPWLKTIIQEGGTAEHFHVQVYE